MRFVLIFFLILCLTACSTHTQLTSGISYLSKYRHTPMSHVNGNPYTSIQAKIRRAASIEPNLKFPARIGLARIENGRFTGIPQAEALAWRKIQKKLGESFGEFIPVNRLVAEMVADSARSHYHFRPSIHNVMNKIRLGAARQHLDLILVYEALNKTERNSNILSVANITIIGGFVLPSKNVEIEGIANAMLIDVIQGYPYGITGVILKKEEIHTSSWGGYDREARYSRIVRTKAVLKLTTKVEKLFRRLRKELQKKQAGK